MFKVNDMYNKVKGTSRALLSSYPATFWDEYRTNHARYDALFNRLYYSFRYFMQNEEDTVADVTSDFIEDVYNHLLLNDKKYSELYRIHVIPDSDYSLTDNYNVTETMDRDTTSSSTDVSGSRSDSKNTTLGARSDSTSTSIGEQTIVDTAKVSPYDSESFYNDTSRNGVNGARTDSESFSKGAETDSESFIKGAETDTSNGSGTEDYTLTRKGNIGVKTVSQMLEEHKEFWTAYEFYSLIFGEICAELLIV